MKTISGFSLVELMIVLMIMGLLSGVLLPNFSKVQNKAKEALVKAVVNTLQLALESYFLSDGKYPSSTDTGIEALVANLKSSGDLSKIPKNPFTGSGYSDDDASGKITYSLDSATSVYSLTAYGIKNQSEILVISNQ